MVTKVRACVCEQLAHARLRESRATAANRTPRYSNTNRNRILPTFHTENSHHRKPEQRLPRKLQLTMQILKAVIGGQAKLLVENYHGVIVNNYNEVTIIFWRQMFKDNERSRGRERKRWIDVVKYNMEDSRLTVEDTGNRAEWRRRTRVADPSPEGFTA